METKPNYENWILFIKNLSEKLSLNKIVISIAELYTTYKKQEINSNISNRWNFGSAIFI